MVHTQRSYSRNEGGRGEGVGTGSVGVERVWGGEGGGGEDVGRRGSIF